MNENLKNKITKYEKLKEKRIKKYNEEMSIIKKIINVLEKFSKINEMDTFETIVFKKYLELENVSKVAKYVNELGYRIKTNSYIGERKYNGTDITEILIKDNVKVEDELKEVVKYLQDKNYNNMLKTF